MLSKIHLHQVEFISIEGREVVRKRRKLFSRLIIPVGNVFLKMTANPVTALPQTQWMKWEQSIEAATRLGLVLRTSPASTAKDSGLSCRRVPGMSLQQILVSCNYSLEQKHEAFRWSLASLRSLHQYAADWGEGIHQSISHGDATANNVIVDMDKGIATWIDFDTRHQPDVSEADRQTDDLRALIYSAAVNLPEPCFPELAEILVNGQIDDDIVKHFDRRLKKEWICLNIFQLAQAPLRWSAAVALREALLKALTVERPVTVMTSYWPTAQPFE